MEAYTPKQRERRRAIFGWADAVQKDLKDLARMVTYLEQNHDQQKPSWGMRPPLPGIPASERMSGYDKQWPVYASWLESTYVTPWDEEQVSLAQVKGALKKAETEVKWGQGFIGEWLKQVKISYDYHKKIFAETKQRSKGRRRSRRARRASRKKKQ